MWHIMFTPNPYNMYVYLLIVTCPVQSQHGVDASITCMSRLRLKILVSLWTWTLASLNDRKEKKEKKRRSKLEIQSMKLAKFVDLVKGYVYALNYSAMDKEYLSISPFAYEGLDQLVVNYAL